jgi:hypothetical protein
VVALRVGDGAERRPGQHGWVMVGVHSVSGEELAVGNDADVIPI